MAAVALQVSPSYSTLFWELKSSEFLRGSLFERQQSSISVSSSGVGIGGRGLEDWSKIGSKKGNSRIRARHLGWRGGRNWIRVRTQRAVSVRALDGDFSSRENAKDTSLEKFKGEKTYQSFFRDQGYEYDRENDFYLDNSTPDERLSGVSREFIRNEDLEQPFHAQGDPEESRPGLRSREWAQVDDKGRLPESSVSQTKEGGYNGNLDDADQRFSQVQGVSDDPNLVSESRPIVDERKTSRIGSREARVYDNPYETRGSPPAEFGAVEEYRGRLAGEFDDRYDLESSGNEEISAIEYHEQQVQVLLPNSGSIRSERTSTTTYGREVEQEESGRSVLYAKQVISLATAQSLGFVTQLWVNVQNLKVVAIEVRPSLLFGDFCSFPLESISKVGDVILIQDDDTILGQRDLFNCFDLVGNDLFTEDGIDLGKVRDYNFRLEDGAVLSIVFDTFGVPLIPSKLLKTYSLTADEVIETQQDGLLVRRGAEKRVRKLSKGFLSRSKKSVERQSPRTQQRNQATNIQYLGQTSERGRNIVERDNYSPGYSTLRQQSKRGNIYSDGTGGFENESFRASRADSNQTSFLDPSSSFSSTSKDLNPGEFEENEITPSQRELPVRDSPQLSENEQTQVPGFGISTPVTRLNGRGLPMPYRTSRRRVENDY